MAEDRDSSHMPTAVAPLSEARSFGSTVKDRHLLVQLAGGHVGRTTRLLRVPYRVGRSSECEIWIEEDGVSRQHAVLEPSNEGFAVTDTKSSNGTFVGGERISKRELCDGDIIQFGPVSAYRYLIVDESQESLMRQLYEASILDALTGATNREHLNRRLRAEVSYARRHKTALSLLLFDIDHFKRVNDTYGHPVGDVALVAVARCVQATLRLEDMVARYGGEEFAVVLRGEDITRAACVGERLCRAVEALKPEIAGGQLRVTISVGCAALDECEEGSADALLALADLRLYKAKNSGRNRVVSASG